MAKNPKKSGKAAKRNDPMTGAMKLFVAGCIAELYLLIIRRFYVNGTSEEVKIAWFDHYLWVLMGAGLAAAAAGLVFAFLWKANAKRRLYALCLIVSGIFVGGVAGLVRWNMSVLSLLCTLIPVIMLLGILWALYDREYALALSILGTSLVALWVYRRVGASMYLGTYVKIAVVLYVVLLLALAAAVKGKKLGKLLPLKADTFPVFLACGLSVAALLTSLVSSVMAYYVLWGMAMIVFALAVYYTVKQL